MCFGCDRAGTHQARKYAQPSTRDMARAKASSSGLIMKFVEEFRAEVCTCVVAIAA